MFDTSTDYIMNGQGFGPVAQELTSNHFGPGFYRPYFDGKHACVTINTGKAVRNAKSGKMEMGREQVRIRDLRDNGIDNPVLNATALRKEQWIELDQVVLKAARFRLQAWADLSAAATYGGFNGMGRMILEHETMSDPGFASVDMDGLTDSQNDAPKFQLEGLPLPITHSDFWLSARKLAISQQGNMPLDTVMAEAAARRVAESIEKTTIGVNTGITYGGASTQTGGYGRTSSVYGYTSFSSRLTYTSVTVPTGSNASSTLANVLAMRDRLYANKFFGPFMLYHTNDWDQYMDNDYILSGGNVATQTLRQRLKSIQGIQDVKRLDMFFSANYASTTGPGGEGFTATATSPFQLILVQLTAEVARAVNGMDITTIQWDAQGGLKKLFKIMAIQVPQLRADNYGNCGIAHGTTA